MGRFELAFHPSVEHWLLALEDGDFAAIMPAIDLLEERGPALGRPAVDTVAGSRHRNMKELRSFGGHLRVLFAFDPGRRAVLLLAGDKRGRWQRWYLESVPVADDRYDEHLSAMREHRKRDLK